MEATACPGRSGGGRDCRGGTRQCPGGSLESSAGGLRLPSGGPGQATIARLQGRDNAVAIEQKLLEDLESLAKVVQSTTPIVPRPAALVRCDELFVAQAIADCRTRLASSVGDTPAAQTAAAAAGLTAGDLCQAADNAYRDERIRLHDWVCGTRHGAMLNGPPPTSPATRGSRRQPCENSPPHWRVSCGDFCGAARNSTPTDCNWNSKWPQRKQCCATIGRGANSRRRPVRMPWRGHRSCSKTPASSSRRKSSHSMNIWRQSRRSSQRLRESAILGADYSKQLAADVGQAIALFDLGQRTEAMIMSSSGGYGDKLGLIQCEYFLARGVLTVVESSRLASRARAQRRLTADAVASTGPRFFGSSRRSLIDNFTNHAARIAGGEDAVGNVARDDAAGTDHRLASRSSRPGR